MKSERSQARLFINGTHVGDVRVHGWEGSWGMGEFLPNDNFSEYSVLFGAWSLLLHADDDQSGLSREAADELRRIEHLIDGLHVRIQMVHSGQWREVGQVNIDGGLIEWKEVWHLHAQAS